MDGEIVSKSEGIRQRYHLLNVLVDGRIALREAEARMGVSCEECQTVKTDFQGPSG